MEKLAQLLNYCAAHPDAAVRFIAIESDASFLSVIKACSRTAGYFYLTNRQTKPTEAFKPNGAIHVLCHIMRKVLSSAAEAGLGALCHNGKEACPLRIALEEMGHPQPANPPWQLTTIPPVVLPQTPSNRNAPRPLIRNFTGFAIAFVTASFQFTGVLARQIVPIIFQASSGIASSGHTVYVLVLPYKSNKKLFTVPCRCRPSASNPGDPDSGPW
jgi:hypothetical protein